MIKLIATDMDGTLLGDEREVTIENAKAVKEAQTQGVTVIVATGRDELEARLPLKQADISCPVISVNGAVTCNEHGEVLLVSRFQNRKRELFLTF
ncbi:HAD family hydrolase [Halalkalibacter alkalisediminis]|uniref:HAD family hydrolase n=1 Tax=Halalkalibacter alkalisediminis TaxID=935616 RepID=UPI003629FB18